MLARGIGANIGLLGSKVSSKGMDARYVSFLFLLVDEHESVARIALTLPADAARVIHFRVLLTSIVLHHTVGCMQTCHKVVPCTWILVAPSPAFWASYTLPVYVLTV